MKLKLLNKRLSLVGAAVALAIAPVTAHAIPILGAQIIVAEAGEVMITFEGQSAGYTSDLYLNLPGNPFGILFTNHTTPIGASISLGSFAAGTELIFDLYVRNTKKHFFTGSGSLNPDLLPHAVVDAGALKTFVSFEDLLGGGDRDYNDFVFSITTVRNVPDQAATAFLLLLGLGSLAVARRRLR